MINLRFHIVSIVAVFLALGIGILTGTTLLDQATVKVLQNTQRTLEQRNDKLNDENGALRDSMTVADASSTEFGGTPMSQLVPGLMSGSPVLIVAVRGIDEASVIATQQAVREAGGAPLGIVWFDERFDLDRAANLPAIASAVGLSRAGEATKAKIVGRLSEVLSAASRPAATAQATTTTGAPAAGDPNLSMFSDLAGAGLVEWQSPTDGEPGPRTLPTDSLRVILVSGEGALVEPTHLVVPLASELSKTAGSVVVAEVRKPRSSVEAATAADVPKRGALVDRFRVDSGLSARLITVDNLDQPFGRLATVLALSEGDKLRSGRFGVAESAESAFPVRRT